MNAFMSDLDFKRGVQPLSERWEGLSELDRALAEDRLTAYRWKKTWADPVSRMVTIIAVVGIVAVFAYLIGSTMRLW